MTARRSKGRRSGRKPRWTKDGAKTVGALILGAAAAGAAWSTPWLGRGIAVVLPRWWAQVAAGAVLALFGLWCALLMQRRPIGGPVPRRPQAIVTALYLFAFLCLPARQIARDKVAANGIVEGGIVFVIAGFGSGILCAGVWFVATRRARKARHDRELSDWEAFQRDPAGVARRAKVRRGSQPDSRSFGGIDIVLMIGAPVAAVAALMAVGWLA